MKDLSKIIQQLESIKCERGKLNIFNHDTLDEAKQGEERTPNRDITVRINGPSSSIILAIISRAEHTLLKECIEKIINDRETKLNAELDKLCAERLNANPVY